MLFRYSLADTRKVYEEFKSKEELIKFIKEKKEEIEINKIIEAGKEFKINWILTLDEIGKPAPQGRGRPRKKAEDSKIEEIKPKRRRGRPRKEKIVSEPEQLEPEESLEEPGEFEDESVEEAPEEEPDEEGQEESKEEETEITKKLEEMKKKKKGRMGRCKRKSCLKVFELEDWQHSSLHWCPECRLLPGYKDYDKGMVG